MNHPFRAFLFRRYPWLILAVLAVALPAVAYLSKPDNLTVNVATVLGGVAGVVFFVQKQKIEELQIFERLFSTVSRARCGYTTARGSGSTPTGTRSRRTWRPSWTSGRPTSSWGTPRRPCASGARSRKRSRRRSRVSRCR